MLSIFCDFGFAEVTCISAKQKKTSYFFAMLSIFCNFVPIIENNT